MRSRTSTWFETKVKYDKTVDDGSVKPIIEQYVVDAFTFSEAEETIIKEMKPYISGQFDVKAIAPTSYGEIFFSDAPADDRWYKAKLQFITIDEKSGKEKRVNSYKLVQAASINGAIKHIEEVMGGTMIDFVIASIDETKITDVFEHKVKTESQL
jgi:hypothetical protein